MDTVPATIPQYIQSFPDEQQKKLNEIYEIIQKAAPMTTEKISWGMPTFVYHGNLVHFAAAKKHIGFYPSPSGVAAFQNELGDLRYSKGCIQFPYDKPLPAELIRRIIAFRIAEQESLFEQKKVKK